MGSMATVRRSTTDSRLAGLCGGLAEHWGVDVLLVRVASVVLVLCGGLGVVLYVAGWLLVPAEGRDTAALDDLLGERARHWPAGVRVTVVALACLAATAVLVPVLPTGVGLVAALAGVWYLASHEKGQGPLPTGSPAPTSRGQAPAVDPAAADRDAFLATPDPVGLYDEPPAPRPTPVRRRDGLAARRLRLATLLVLGLVLTGLNLLDRTGVAVGGAGYTAAALLVVGLAVVAGAWWGRARGLLPIGLLLVPAVVLSVLAAQVPFERFGHAQRSYERVADLPSTPDLLGSGSARVDLSRLALTEDATYASRLETGRLEVRVPDDVNVEVRYAVEVGAVETFGQQTQSGFDLRGSAEAPGAVAGRPTLTLDLDVEAGQVAVVR